jgi:hypothetical protein
MDSYFLDAPSFWCPNGGQPYITSCGPIFFGCCESNPCQTGCPQGDVRPLAFNPQFTFADLNAVECVPSAPSEASTFAAVGLDPPFAGCCSADPNVHNGCPIGDLYAATMPDVFNSSGAPVMILTFYSLRTLIIT